MGGLFFRFIIKNFSAEINRKFKFTKRKIRVSQTFLFVCLFFVSVFIFFLFCFSSFVCLFLSSLTIHSCDNRRGNIINDIYKFLFVIAADDLSLRPLLTRILAEIRKEKQVVTNRTIFTFDRHVTLGHICIPWPQQLMYNNKRQRQKPSSFFICRLSLCLTLKNIILLETGKERVNGTERG